MTPLIKFTIKNQINHVKELLKYKRILIDERDYIGFTALMYSSELEYTEIAKLLIKKKANIEFDDINGRTALSLSCYFQNFEMIKLLVENNAFIETEDNRGYTPLYITLNQYNPSTDIVGYLIKKGAMLIKENNSSLNKLFQNKNNEMIKFLIENPNVDINEINNGVSFLYLAIINEKFKIIKHLVKYRVNIDYLYENKYGVLYYCIKNNFMNFLKYFLKVGAKLSLLEKSRKELFLNDECLTILKNSHHYLKTHQNDFFLFFHFDLIFFYEKNFFLF
jgi:ankyrin repeat protein